MEDYKKNSKNPREDVEKVKKMIDAYTSSKDD
jgi:hypothetical protein